MFKIGTNQILISGHFLIELVLRNRKYFEKTKLNVNIFISKLPQRTIMVTREYYLIFVMFFSQSIFIHENFNNKFMCSMCSDEVTLGDAPEHNCIVIYTKSIAGKFLFAVEDGLRSIYPVTSMKKTFNI